MGVSPSTALQIFFSYAQDAQQDEQLCNELKKHLSSLQREQLISSWSEIAIQAGQQRDQEIDKHLNTADILLFLISADFLASDYYTDTILKRAMERHENKTARIVPIIIRPCDWKGTPFGKLQVLPMNEKPVTSWPQLDDAFVSIVEGLRVVVQELRAHPVQSSSPAFAIQNIPYERNLLFTGRESILEQVHQNFQAGTPTVMPQAISGLGGMGKTQTAVEYAYRYQDDYSNIFWMNADSATSLFADFVAAAQHLQLTRKDETDREIILRAVKRWLQEHDRWLLILDNADDLAVLKDFLPAMSRGHILITTRSHVTGRTVQRIELKQISLEDGARFLLQRAKHLAPHASLEAASAEERQIAKAIVQATDGLPLALDQAGAYIEETECSLQEYLSIFQTEQATLLKRRGNLTDDHPDPVATTWALSFAKVEQDNPIAADVLRLCSFLDPESIPEAIFTQGRKALEAPLHELSDSLHQFNEAIGALLTYSLISRNPNHTLTIHRLVQAVLKQEMSESTQQYWQEQAIKALDLAFPENSYEYWQECLLYLPHIQTALLAIEHLRLTLPEAASLLNQAGRYLQAIAQYPQAEPLFQRALAIREHALGPEHPDTATTLNNLAWLYHAQGKYEQAEPLYQRALAIREHVLGPEHPDTATTLDNLARLYRAQGKYEQAEPFFQRALAISEHALGPEHPDTAATLNNLAVLYSDQGKHEQAEPLFQRALAIKEKVLGPEHPDTAATLDNLAQLYSDQGKYKQAEPLFQRDLAISEKVLGPEHPDTATTLHNLAGLYSAQGKDEQAEPLYQRALAIYEKVLGPEHPWTATTLNNLAMLYYAQSKYEQAEPLFLRDLAISGKVLGPEHPSTATTLNNLALLYSAQGKYEQAEPLYRRALAIYEKVLGPEHPDTATTLNNLALLYSAQSKHAQAEPLYQRARAIREKQKRTEK